jgi:hypothetical protein
MNRLDDLMLTMPYRIANAISSPPVEIVILNYSSTDGILDYITDMVNLFHPVEGVYISGHSCINRKYFHSARAYNMALLAGKGEWVVLTPADVFVYNGYVATLRERISEGSLWCNTDRKRRSTIAFNKAEFIAAGGYDDRFDTYGPDDRDIIERMERRCAKRGSIPDYLLGDIFTPADKKIANYPPTGKSHRELGKDLMKYYYENKENGQLVANQGIEWQKWSYE